MGANDFRSPDRKGCARLACLGASVANLPKCFISRSTTRASGQSYHFLRKAQKAGKRVATLNAIKKSVVVKGVPIKFSGRGGIGRHRRLGSLPVYLRGAAPLITSKNLLAIRPCGFESRRPDQKLHFVLDHINRDASQSNRENLRLICPNCDSQLETYKSKNKNSKRYGRKKFLHKKLDGVQKRP